MKRTLTAALTVCLACATLSCKSKAPTSRPASWGQPVQVAGVPNLYKVSPGLYRSAQPTAEGMRNLAAMGVKTVVNLRSFHSDRDEIGDAPLRGERIRVETWRPEREDVVRFLRVVKDPANAPVLVHCQHGSDRTGVMCAVYRIAVQGWSKQQAIEEMTRGGYGFHKIWQNLPAWVKALDIEAVKNEAGMKAGTKGSGSGAK